MLMGQALEVNPGDVEEWNGLRWARRSMDIMPGRREGPWEIFQGGRERKQITRTLGADLSKFVTHGDWRVIRAWLM